MIEFRNVATRPLKNNGLGLQPIDARRLRDEFEREFALLADTNSIYTEWKSIVDSGNVIGKTIHDARLVAVSISHSVSTILTFNTSQFNTLAQMVPNLQVLNPAAI